jgi:hypothetical protein
LTREFRITRDKPSEGIHRLCSLEMVSDLLFRFAPLLKISFSKTEQWKSNFKQRLSLILGIFSNFIARSLQAFRWVTFKHSAFLKAPHSFYNQTWPESRYCYRCMLTPGDHNQKSPLSVYLKHACHHFANCFLISAWNDCNRSESDHFGLDQMVKQHGYRIDQFLPARPRFSLINSAYFLRSAVGTWHVWHCVCLEQKRRFERHFWSGQSFQEALPLTEGWDLLVRGRLVLPQVLTASGYKLF